MTVTPEYEGGTNDRAFQLRISDKLTCHILELAIYFEIASISR